MLLVVVVVVVVVEVVEWWLLVACSELMVPDVRACIGYTINPITSNSLGADEFRFSYVSIYFMSINEPLLGCCSLLA